MTTHLAPFTHVGVWVVVCLTTPSRTGEACMSIKDASKRASGELLKGKNPQTHFVSETALSDSRIQMAIDFMEANLHRKIPLAELAEVANLSPSHISRLFKTQTRLSPGEYLS